MKNHWTSLRLCQDYMKSVILVGTHSFGKSKLSESEFSELDLEQANSYSHQTSRQIRGESSAPNCPPEIVPATVVA
jgi:hypothetical protein